MNNFSAFFTCSSKFTGNLADFLIQNLQTQTVRQKQKYVKVLKFLELLFPS